MSEGRRISEEDIIMEAYNQLERGFEGKISEQNWGGYSLGIVALTKALIELGVDKNVCQL